jgi:hypothetical protein
MLSFSSLMTMQTADFDSALLESIDETVRGLLGQKVLDALYANLENKSGIKREAIPNQIPALSLVFEKHFGSAAPTIVRAIARKLYSKLSVQFTSKEGYSLADYVKDAKNRRDRSLATWNPAEPDNSQIH